MAGKWYYPKEDRHYRKTGAASWYGDAFHGRLTANGEIYDMTHLTAAHPTMPLPSYARVTNLKNGSSVVVRVNDRGEAPYRAVVTHGFTLDGEGRKMSKSLGNVISPLDVAAQRGADVLRLWVAMIDFLDDMRLSTEILDRNGEAYRKVRNTFRYLLGNLNGFDHARDGVPYGSMPEIDRWALQQLEQVRRRWLAAYEQHQYHLIYHGLHNFCAVTLSSFYLDVLKDRLYTFPPRHPERRAARGSPASASCPTAPAARRSSA